MTKIGKFGQIELNRNPIQSIAMKTNNQFNHIITSTYEDEVLCIYTVRKTEHFNSIWKT